MTYRWLPASLNNARKWGWCEIDIWKAKQMNKVISISPDYEQAQMNALIPNMLQHLTTFNPSKTRSFWRKTQRQLRKKRKKTVTLVACLGGEEGGRASRQWKTLLIAWRDDWGGGCGLMWLIKETTIDPCLCGIWLLDHICVCKNTNVFKFSYLQYRTINCGYCIATILWDR